MVGETISHYKIIEKLGEGGMGTVYKAEDTLLRRPVALKFLAPKWLGDQTTQIRFQREAQAAGSLDHPNICTVYGIERGAGSSFIVMAFIPGQSLDRLVAARRLTIGDALDIAIQTGEGLKEAHKKGIVHRDVKSANIMVTPEGRVVIMDFGLAQLSERSRITRSGTALGTMTYMSPEQALGKRVDRRADIWGLGVVLYEMLTGRFPFQGNTIDAVCRAILKDTPPPVTELCRDLPDDACWVMSKALAKRPDERYQHIDDFIVDMRALLKKARRDTALPHSGGGQRPAGVKADAQTMTLANGNHVTIDTSLNLGSALPSAHLAAETPPREEPGAHLGESGASETGQRHWRWVFALAALAMLIGLAIVWWRSLNP